MVAIVRPRRLLVSVAVFILAASAPPLLGAEFLEHYKAGLAAIESQDWEGARDRMDRAIQIQPKSKVRIKKALYFKHYLPHYYLGVSLYNLDDCVGALVAWQESTDQGVIQKLSEYAQLEAGREVCLRRRAELESTLLEAESLIAAAGVAAIRARNEFQEVKLRTMTRFWWTIGCFRILHFLLPS